MRYLHCAVGLAALSLVACGGGGGSSSSRTDNNIPPRTSDPAAAAIEQYVADLATAIEAERGTVSKADLSGLWIEAWSLWRSVPGTNGAAATNDIEDLGVDAYYVEDNGTSLTISHCNSLPGSPAITLDFDAATQKVTWNEGGEAIVGAVRDNSVIEFSTTPYGGNYADASNQNSTIASRSKWVKVDDNETGLVGSLVLGTGALSQVKDISCVSYYQSTKKINGTTDTGYVIQLSDADGEAYETEGANGDPFPSRTGNHFYTTYLYNGQNVQITLSLK